MAVGTLATKEIGCVVALYFPPKADSPAPLSPAGPVHTLISESNI